MGARKFSGSLGWIALIILALYGSAPLSPKPFGPWRVEVKDAPLLPAFVVPSREPRAAP